MVPLRRPRISLLTTSDVRVNYLEFKHVTLETVANKFSDHLKSHQIFDCNYCFEQFDDPGEYIRHRDVESGGTCTTTERLQGPRRAGIDLQQWTRITEIHKKRTTKRYNDSDKWMDMWKVIFPGVPAPPSPC
jgi:hypothetical protein